MLAATLWSLFILWQALFHWDQTAIGLTGGERPWLLPVIIVASTACSFVAFLLLRSGSQNAVRIPLWLAALTGLQGILVTACAVSSLWIVWRARVNARWEAKGVPTGPPKRGRAAG